MSANLLIGIIYLVLGVSILVGGLGVSYFIYRRTRDDEETPEPGENRVEEILRRLEEDRQFVVIAITATAASAINVFVSLTAAVFYVAGVLTTAVGFKNAINDAGNGPDPPPNNDSQHIDPTAMAGTEGDLADAVESGDHARDQVFESSDGETRTLHQIMYYGWKEGGDIEQDGDDFIIDGTRYTPVDDTSRWDADEVKS